MPETAGIPDFNSPVAEHARKDFPLLDADRTVAEALDRIRREGVGERVIYFFAVDSDKRLVGVLPTRRLLTAPLETPLREIMVRRVIAIPATASVLDACEFFVLYKFFAFPVIDEQRRIVGVIDVSLFAEEILGEREEQTRPAAPVRDDVFEVLGFHLEQIRDARAQSGGRVLSHNGARPERKCQRTIDERDDSDVAVGAGDMELVCNCAPSRIDDRNSARIVLRQCCCCDRVVLA
jgi:CBS domain-containing protein